jgi:hypothetical protein
MVCFARVSRSAMAVADARNARAISVVLNPHSIFSAKATCASSGTRGWQHTNIMRKQSSLMCSSKLAESSLALSTYS